MADPRAVRIGLGLAALMLGLAGVWGASAVAAEGEVAQTLQATAEGEDLLVFVGEKLSVEDVTAQERAAAESEAGPGQVIVLMDEYYQARYRVLQVVHGRYDSDVIEFDAADHYGEPAFASYDTVLLFVSKGEHSYHHVKYQYYPVFRTSSGGWAGCAPIGSGDAEERAGIVTPHRIDFGPEAYFDLRKLDWRVHRKDFAGEYFRFERGRARCRLGNTLEELFEVKRRTVLKERGFFADTAAASP